MTSAYLTGAGEGQNSLHPKIGLYQPYPHTLGGLQTVVMDLAGALPAFGYAPVVIVPEAGKFSAVLEQKGLPFVVSDPGKEWHVYGRGSKSLSYLFSLRRVFALVQYWRKLSLQLRASGISLLHCNDYRGVMLAAPAARLAGIPVIWHMHGFVPSKLANLAAAKLVHHTVPVSRGMLDYLKFPRWLFGKYKVINNGLTPDHTPLLPETVPGAPVVLAVGTLHPRKGYETLLHAFRRVAAKVPSAECWIVGPEFGDGSYGRQLRQLADTLGLSQKVKFTGHSNDVRAFMSAATILAVPSRVEAFGMVAIEAMLLGKPVVACRTGGLKDIVRHRETGCLVEPENIAEMAKALTELLNNRALAQRMGESGRTRVRDRFSLEKMTASFADFYGQLLAQAV